MNPRTLLNYLRTPSGKFLIFGAVLGGGLALVGRFRDRDVVPALVTQPARANRADSPQVVEAVQRPMEVFRPPAPKPDAPVVALRTNPPAPVHAEPRPDRVMAVLPPISLIADTTVGKPPPRRRPVVYAPYGRLIPCETVITVDSSSLRTPIIGLITEDVYHAGRLVIPAGTEVHGTAQADRSRERIASGNAWTLVWQSGRELRLRGLALDREFESTTNHVGWGITDGSAGLRGSVIRADELAELKLFAATFLSGAAGALTEKESTLLGSIDSRSLNNAPLKGAQEILKVYAQRIQDTIARDGFYVRVPSGKQFYLYVLQSIEPGADAPVPADPATGPESEPGASSLPVPPVSEP